MWTVRIESKREEKKIDAYLLNFPRTSYGKEMYEKIAREVSTADLPASSTRICQSSMSMDDRRGIEKEINRITGINACDL